MRGPVPPGRPQLALYCLTAALAMLALTSPAGATFSSGDWSGPHGGSGSGGWSGGWSGVWPADWFGEGFGTWLGISLRELTDGDGKDDSFSSLDGSFTFSDFEVDLSGFTLRNLDLYRVFPLQDGFKLLAPMGALFGSQGQLDLSYEVEANQKADQQILIEAMSMSILGFAVGSEATMEAMAKLLAEPGDPEPLETLWVRAAGLCGHGDAHDVAKLSEPLETLSIEEVLTVMSGGHGEGCDCFGGLALGALVTHHFNAEVFVVPEPGTALTLGAGLVGLVALGRRRRRGQGPSR